MAFAFGWDWTLVELVTLLEFMSYTGISNICFRRIVAEENQDVFMEIGNCFGDFVEIDREIENCENLFQARLRVHKPTSGLLRTLWTIVFDEKSFPLELGFFRILGGVVERNDGGCLEEATSSMTIQGSLDLVRCNDDAEGYKQNFAMGFESNGLKRVDGFGFS
ncbi:unnamed protein product [Ilex paraguariensis]|uniref:Uncharacterized protein n=1 Tax=Ilex paraguariensis TaxID=185542 RepID=A0ABC8RNV8_9AQUA